ncbi:DUF2258 domain-containing protein [Thermoproteus tenax]|uniref:DUF2258 domain-containing protein n=1 Tax=Thermoproteus tenax (strain ATCC 35583 / DSM 2078 / JCM 9277 / NBRC 100435 / Kra 1) TaxID=768679 RepID=G4RLL3_THETK|nr:single- stranded DNA-binding family protein [Thermoproteus tenax]CCC82458.1 conserved hypothetical protein [Thermoproteus tenax Kra 1]
MSWRPVENIERDLEKAEENSALYGGILVKGGNVVEISTGVIIAARFADKLRRAAFAAFKNMVKQEEILKSVADLNRSLYEKLVAMGIGKLDIIRISVEAKVEDGRLTFGEPRVEHFVPSTRVKELQDQLESCKALLQGLKSKLEDVLKELA